MEPLTIDVASGVVSGAGYRATGQWVVFWALLATEHADGTAMRSEELLRLRPWDGKAPASVGKEVARHVGRPTARAYLHAEQATRTWALRGEAPPPILLPSPRAVRDWLEARRPRGPHPDALAKLTAATVAFQDGRMEDVVGLLDAVDDAGIFAAWRDTVRARAAAKLGDAEVPEAIVDAWRARADGSPVTLAVVARLTAATAFRDRPFTDAHALGDLRVLAARVGETGDLATLGVVLNVLGVAQRRAGDALAAARSHELAASYLGLTGDLYSLQGALYNLALALEAAAEARSEPRPPAAAAALHACVSLCERFNLARDSAQAEVTAAKWAVEDGDRDGARHWLGKAEALAAGIESELESAFFHYVRGLCAGRWPGGDADATGELQRAERLYAAGGDQDGVVRVRRAAAKLGVKLVERAGSRGRR